MSRLSDFLFYEEPGITLYCGDAMMILRELPPASVHCCVTSPPYWGLRDYGTEPLAWGGDPGCEHEWDQKAVVVGRGDHGSWSGSSSNLKGNTVEAVAPGPRKASGGGPCLRCSAWLGSLGLERTPEEYVTALVTVFREVRRVLRDDGTLWLNLGDSYAVGGPAGGKGKQHSNVGSIGVPKRGAPSNLKPKDIVGIPWRVAFALQADGWWLRSDIIWHKPNPMPESVVDRPTKAHEYLFLLAKSERYYYDAEASAEPARHAGRIVEYDGSQKNCSAGDGVNDRRTLIDRTIVVGSTRNRRTVWTIATEPYPEAHFATFPPDLVKPCILAGCPSGGTVLDPFGGALTTVHVAKELGRRAVAIELNRSYLTMGLKRLRQEVLPLA